MRLTHYMFDIYLKISVKLIYLIYLRTTNYLRDNSDVHIALSGNTEKQRGFAYVKVPR